MTEEILVSFIIIMNISFHNILIDVKLSNEHLVTVEAGQDEPHGPILESADRSILGTDVKIDKSSKKK